MRLTMEDVLRTNGLDVALLHNPRFTKTLASELVKRGYRKVQISVGGERRNYWTNEESLQELDVAALLDKTIAKVQPA